MYIPVKAIVITVGLFLLLFIVISKIVTRFINKEASIQLLKSDAVIEKPIKSHLLSLLSSVLISITLTYLLKIDHGIVGSLGLFYYTLFFL